MSAHTFKQYERVRLKSGGCPMMIVRIGELANMVKLPAGYTGADEINASCQWHTLKGEAQERVYPLAILEPAP